MPKYVKSYNNSYKKLIYLHVLFTECLEVCLKTAQKGGRDEGQRLSQHLLQ